MPDDGVMKTHDKLLVLLISMLFVFGVFSFFRTPVYADLVKEVVREFVEGVGLILAFKFGVHQQQPPAPPPGTTAQATVQAFTPPKP